jgi:hypothetical protein
MQRPDLGGAKPFTFHPSTRLTLACIELAEMLRTGLSLFTLAPSRFSRMFRPA